MVNKQRLVRMERSSEGRDFYLLLQGTFLSLLAVSWLTRLLFRQRARRRPDARPLVLYSSVCDVLLCCLASLGCLLLNSQHRDVVTTSHQVTLYAALAMSSILSLMSVHCERLALPRALDKLATSLAFSLHLYFTASQQDTDQPRQLLSLTAIAASLISSAMSTFSVPAAARYICTASTVMFTQLQGSWTLHATIQAKVMDNNKKLAPILFSVHILTIFSLHMLVMALVRVDDKRMEQIKTTFSINKIFKTKKKRVSQEKLVRESLNETVETEPINFSFYFKDEISDEIKNVMKTIDEMLINETGKSLEVISEEPELKESPENVYVNVNMMLNVLDDSKLEESEVM